MAQIIKAFGLLLSIAHAFAQIVTKIGNRPLYIGAHSFHFKVYANTQMEHFRGDEFGLAVRGRIFIFLPQRIHAGLRIVRNALEIIPI